MTLIPVCLAMQVTDIFAQVFFVAGLGAGITGVFQRGLEPERSDKWSEKLPVFVGFCFIASLISVLGGLRSRILRKQVVHLIPVWLTSTLTRQCFC